MTQGSSIAGLDEAIGLAGQHLISEVHVGLVLGWSVVQIGGNQYSHQGKAVKYWIERPGSGWEPLPLQAVCHPMVASQFSRPTVALLGLATA